MDVHERISAAITAMREKQMRDDALDALRLIAEGHHNPRQLAQSIFEKYEVLAFNVEGME